MHLPDMVFCLVYINKRGMFCVIGTPAKKQETKQEGKIVGVPEAEY